MGRRFAGKERIVVAGVDFGPGTKDLVRDLTGLCRHTGMTLRLVHVIDPHDVATRGARLPGEYVVESIAKRSEEIQAEQAVKQLAALKDSIKDIPVQTQVAHGPIAEALKADALFHRASLIATSSRPMSHRLMPRGFSTAMSLMADSPIPVMVLPAGDAIDLGKSDLCMMVADDLSERSRGALRVACELGGVLEPARFVHLHIHHRTEQALREWALMAEEAFHQQAETPETDIFTPETIVQKTRHDIETQMRERLSPTMFAGLPANAYQPVVGFGDVLDEFERLIAKEKPDILITGRHQFFHSDPLGIGKVPFYALLGLHRPVIVGPEQALLR